MLLCPSKCLFLVIAWRNPQSFLGKIAITSFVGPRKQLAQGHAASFELKEGQELLSSL